MSDTGWDIEQGSPCGVSMVGFRDRADLGLDLRVAGIPAVTLVFGFGDPLVIHDNAGCRHVTGFVSGAAAGAMRVSSRRAQCVEVRLPPLQAYSLLEVIPREFGSCVVDVDDIWGRRAVRLRAQLAEATTWNERFTTIRCLLSGTEPQRAADIEIVESWQRLVSSRGQVPIGALAESCGWSRKRLWQRFEAQVGLTPKRAAMLIRFRSAVDGLLAGRPPAVVAAACGYTDQSHLCRDVASFAQTTPGGVAALELSVIAKLRRQSWSARCGTFVQDRRRPGG